MPPEPTTPARPSRPPLTAADVMTPSPRTCSAFSTLTEAALIFRDEDCGAVPVMDEGKPVGVLTDRDVALAVAAFPDLPSRPVSDVVGRGVVSVGPDATLDEVRERFAGAKVHRLLVVEPDGRLAGIVAWADVLPHLTAAEAGAVVSGVLDPPHDPPPPAVPAPPAGGWGTPRPARGSWASPGEFWALLKETAAEWSEDKVPRLGAALAFYSLLSIAPLLILAIAFAGLVFGQEAARGQIVGQLRGLVGPEGGKAIQDMIASADRPRTGTFAAAVGVVTLLFGASGVFGQLQDAMNTVWEVQPKPGRGLLGAIKDRFWSLAMVFGTGFLLLVSLLLGAVTAGFFKVAGGLVPGLAGAVQVTETVTTFAVIALLFAMLFKYLPDAEVAWRDVRVGAGLTALFFMAGKGLIGLYLGRSSYGSAYGAAGSLVVLIVWVYYSSQIVFLGAEFTKVYAARYGSKIVPSPGAEPVTDDARAHQGIPRTA